MGAFSSSSAALNLTTRPLCRRLTLQERVQGDDFDDSRALLSGILLSPCALLLCYVLLPARLAFRRLLHAHRRCLAVPRYKRGRRCWGIRPVPLTRCCHSGVWSRCNRSASAIAEVQTMGCMDCHVGTC